MRRAKGRVAGKPRAMRDIVKAFRRPHGRPLPARLPETETAASQGFRTAHSFQIGRVASDVPHRYATRVLAESLGKPSLWVIISAPWYTAVEPTGPGQGHFAAPQRRHLGHTRRPSKPLLSRGTILAGKG